MNAVEPTTLEFLYLDFTPDICCEANRGDVTCKYQAHWVARHEHCAGHPVVLLVCDRCRYWEYWKCRICGTQFDPELISFTRIDNG